MWRKIIDDYRLYYLNDLFKIKLILENDTGIFN